MTTFAPQPSDLTTLVPAQTGPSQQKPAKVDRPGWNDPDFKVASSVALRGKAARSFRRPMFRAIAALAVRRDETATATALLARIPVVVAPLPPTVGADRIVARMNEGTRWARLPGMKTARGTKPGLGLLELTDDPEGHTKGKSRQAVRTNTRAAKTAGCSVRPVASGAEARQLDRLVQAQWDSTFDMLFDRQDQVAMVAVDADGTPVAVTAVSTAGSWAHLDLFVTLNDKQDQAVDARYLLHTELVTELHARGIRHLAAECSLTISSHLQYQQHLLGYRPATVKVVRA